MKFLALLALALGFRRAARPATVRLQDIGPLPAYRPADHWPEPHPVEYYAPKPMPPPIDPVVEFIASLSREKRLQLSRIVRHGYGPALRVAA